MGFVGKLIVTMYYKILKNIEIEIYIYIIVLCRYVKIF